LKASAVCGALRCLGRVLHSLGAAEEKAIAHSAELGSGGLEGVLGYRTEGA